MLGPNQELILQKQATATSKFLRANPGTTQQLTKQWLDISNYIAPSDCNTFQKQSHHTGWQTFSCTLHHNIGS